jgi:dTDP-4-dehydrorhamnose reductase
MKIMIAGCDGQLGRDCASVLQREHEIVGVDIDELDIGDHSSVEHMVRGMKPSVIINCAAYTNVDAAESQQEAAWHVNVRGPANLAEAARKYDSLLIHVSTDYVFDGQKKVPEAYVEDDEPNPLSYYGTTKLEGERAVCEITGRYMILRTAWMYGINGNNFLKTMLRLALRYPQKEIRVVNDQFGSPTWSYSLALQIKKLIEVNGQGIYHTTAEGHCTWYEAAEYFLQKMAVTHSIKPCASEEYPTPTQRPQNSILKNTRLQKENINIMPHWQDGIDHYVSHFRERLIGELKD